MPQNGSIGLIWCSVLSNYMSTCIRVLSLFRAWDSVLRQQLSGVLVSCLHKRGSHIQRLNSKLMVSQIFTPGYFLHFAKKWLRLSWASICMSCQFFIIKNDKIILSVISSQFSGGVWTEVREKYCWRQGKNGGNNTGSRDLWAHCVHVTRGGGDQCGHACFSSQFKLTIEFYYWHNGIMEKHHPLFIRVISVFWND